MSKKLVEEKRVTLEAVQDFEFAEDGHSIYAKKKGAKFGVYESFAERLIKNKQAKIISSDVEYDIEGKVIVKVTEGAGANDKGDNNPE